MNEPKTGESWPSIPDRGEMGERGWGAPRGEWSKSGDMRESMAPKVKATGERERERAVGVWWKGRGGAGGTKDEV